MNENSYQKLAELVTRAPRLLGPGGLFGGLNQEHGLMVDFIKFVRGLKIGNNMSPETVNIRSFVAYLGERKNAEDVARKLYDMRQDGEIGDDPHVKAKNTLLNLAETLIDLGVGEKPENVGGDYEGVLRRAVVSPQGERRLPGEEKAKTKAGSTAPASHGAMPQAATPAPGREVTSTEGDLQPGAAEISGDTFRDSGLLRPLISPVTGEAGAAADQAASGPAGRETGEALAGTKATPGAERRHIAQLPDGGRMLRKGPKKHGQRQEQGQGSGSAEAKQDQGRQAAPGRTPGQDFANHQAAQPQKSRVGRRVAGGAGIAGSLALIKGMYGGAAANAATFGVLQTILDLLT